MRGNGLTTRLHDFHLFVAQVDIGGEQQRRIARQFAKGMFGRVVVVVAAHNGDAFLGL